MEVNREQNHPNYRMRKKRRISRLYKGKIKKRGIALATPKVNLCSKRKKKRVQNPLLYYAWGLKLGSDENCK